tara:strand:+ start:368 stop:1453 length:1086 start_codon:yes stop_codon:yes gene_type:complete
MIKKGQTLRQQRADIIKRRAEREKADAKKQGISVEDLRQKRRDTFSTVLSPLTVLPFGRALSLAGKGTSRLKKLLSGAKKTKPSATKLSKTTKTTKPSVPPTKTAKTTKTSKTTQTKTKTRSKTKVTPTSVKRTKTTTKVNRPLAGQNKVRDNIIKGALVTGTGASLSNLLPKRTDSKPKVTKPKVEKPKMRPDSIKPKGTQNIVKSPPIKRTNITAGGNVGFGPKGNIFASSEKRRKELMEKYGGTGSAAAKAAMKGTQGNMVSRAAGGLRPVPEGNKGKGLSKLPTDVRNKMGFMKKGGKLTSNKAKINKVKTGLRKAVKAHTGQAKMLGSIKLKKGGKVIKMRGGGSATRGINFNRGY